MTVPTRKTRLFARGDVDREAFVDKLRQRWLFEHGAVTLYQSAIARLKSDKALASLLPALQRFREEERLHAAMIESLLVELGHGDLAKEPLTAEVEIGATELRALRSLLRTPGLTPRHVLEVLLMAERFDGAGWEVLTSLAKEAQLDDDYLRSFRAAGREEAEHQHVLRAHLDRLDREALFGHLSG